MARPSGGQVFGVGGGPPGEAGTAGGGGRPDRVLLDPLGGGAAPWDDLARASWPGLPDDGGASRAGRSRLRAAAAVAPGRHVLPDPVPEPGDPSGTGADGLPGGGPPAPGSERPDAGRRRWLDGVRWRLPPRTAGVALVALLLIGGAVALRAAAQPAGEPVTIEEPAGPVAGAAGAATRAPAAGPTADAAATVRVHVVGQVASPDVVVLPAGSRVGDAVAAAGGALPGADLAGLNLAAVVEDGAQIRVPAPGEVPPTAGTGGAPVAGAPTAAGGTSASGGAPGVDVNTADSATLQTLPGIGPVLADRIVAWREEHGAFADVDALLDVPGIGPAVLGQIREQVRA